MFSWLTRPRLLIILSTVPGETFANFAIFFIVMMANYFNVKKFLIFDYFLISNTNVVIDAYKKIKIWY